MENEINKLKELNILEDVKTIGKEIRMFTNKLDEQPQEFSNITNADRRFQYIERECLINSTYEPLNKLFKLPLVVKKCTGEDLTMSEKFLDTVVSFEIDATTVLRVIHFYSYTKDKILKQ